MNSTRGGQEITRDEIAALFDRNTVRVTEIFQNLIFARLSSDTEVAPGWPWKLV